MSISFRTCCMTWFQKRERNRKPSGLGNVRRKKKKKLRMRLQGHLQTEIENTIFVRSKMPKRKPKEGGALDQSLFHQRGHQIEAFHRLILDKRDRDARLELCVAATPPLASSILTGHRKQWQHSNKRQSQFRSLPGSLTKVQVTQAKQKTQLSQEPRHKTQPGCWPTKLFQLYPTLEMLGRRH